MHTMFIQDPKGDALKREVQLYDDLGSVDEDTRINAARTIITELDSVPLAVLERHLDRRLLRGLASGRNASRIGFSIVLTELLSMLFSENGRKAYAEITFDKLVEWLVRRTQPQGDVSGQVSYTCKFLLLD